MNKYSRNTKSKQFTSLIAVAIVCLSFATGCMKKADSATSRDSANAVNSNPASKMAVANRAESNQPAGPAIKSGTLSNFLPDLSGYTKGSPEHVDMNMSGMNWSSAKSVYTNGDSRVTINIFDYNHQAGLAAAYSMYTTGNLNIETDDEVTRSQTVGGFPGWINWKKKSNSGSVGVIVGDRIWVVVEATKASSIDDLVAMAQKVDLAGLAKAS